MNILDVAILIPILYAAYIGFNKGFIIELFFLLAIVVGIYVGVNFSDVAASYLQKQLNVHSEYLPVYAFTLTFIGVGAAIYFGGKVLEKVIKIAQLSLLNKISGLVFGMVKTLYILSVLFVLLDSYDEKQKILPEKKIQESLLYNPVKQLSLKTIPSLQSSAIFRKNQYKKDADSTGLTIEQVIRAKNIADSLGIGANDAKTIVEIHQKYSEK